MNHINHYLSIILIGFSITVTAQTKLDFAKDKTYPQPATPVLLDNYLFSTYYADAKNVRNLLGYDMFTTRNFIKDFSISPTGSTYAVLYTNGKNTLVGIYDVAYSNARALGMLKDLPEPTALCYTANGRELVVVCHNSKAYYYNTTTYSMNSEVMLPIGSAAQKVIASPDNKFLAVTTPSNVIIINNETRTVRLSLEQDKTINDVAFSEDGTLFAILTDTFVKLYSTSDYKNLTTVNVDARITNAVSIHPDGKYICVAHDGGVISFFNIYDPADKVQFTEPSSHMNYVRFVKDGQKNVYLSYNTDDAIQYRQIKGFLPHYTRLVQQELNDRMMEWCKRREGETEAAFENRVTEEAKARQKVLFAEEISTNLASSMGAVKLVSLGKYNVATNTLSLTMEGAKPVNLQIPPAEAATVSNVNDLVMSDVKYGVTNDDKLAITSAKVYNKTTGKEYIYNNSEEVNLEVMKTDDTAVSLELIKQANTEETNLKAVTDTVMEKAVSKNLISDHTHIAVNTRITTDHDANGKLVKNYHVDVEYTVDAEYSITDDFAPGKYKIEESNAAMATLNAICKAFEGEFAKYLTAGKKVILKVTGTADAKPVLRTISYNGCYGNFTNAPYYLNDNLSSMTVTSNSGVTSNEQLAFLRAQGVHHYLEENLPKIKEMKTDYHTGVEVMDKVGGEYRRISVKFIFVDAF